MSREPLARGLIACVVFGVVASPAVARPRVSLNLPGAANAATPIPLSYATNGVRASSRLVIQRREGTASAWRTVLRLPRAKTGSAQMPGLPLGAYDTRIADLGSRGKVLAEQKRALKVFGRVPFSTLFVHNEAVIGFNGNTGPGVVTTPSKTFQYAFGGVAGVGNPAVTVSNNRCRSAHFEFVPGFPTDVHGLYDANTGSITVVQETLDPVSATAAFNTLASLDATLVPGKSWSINSAMTGVGEGIYIYVNGFALCYSDVPFTSK